MVKKVWQTDRRTDRRTDGQTENTICRAAWSQLKILSREILRLPCLYNKVLEGGMLSENDSKYQNGMLLKKKIYMSKF